VVKMRSHGRGLTEDTAAGGRESRVELAVSSSTLNAGGETGIRGRSQRSKRES